VPFLVATPHGDAVLCVAGKGVDGRGNDRHCAAWHGNARQSKDVYSGMYLK